MVNGQGKRLVNLLIFHSIVTLNLVYIKYESSTEFPTFFRKIHYAMFSIHRKVEALFFLISLKHFFLPVVNVN